MGMDLVSEKGAYFRFCTVAWHKVMALGRLYGWQPMGTERPALRPVWDNNYITNSGQLVTEVDALALSVALQVALDDVPDRSDVPKMIELTPGDTPYRQVIKAIEKEVGEGVDSIITHDPNLTPFEFFSGDYKQKLVDFIEFCQHGGFRIW